MKQDTRIYSIVIKGTRIVVACCSGGWVERELVIWRRHYGEVEAVLS